ncbi:hypothetical protein BV25DRAFT_1819704 [Artomyces pyxidatus]|uniref:Uncharacterized protein n=1 Tax=Artomyces pyxidatus TaxID=48021 RepID=A0ACB8TG44_9AGAM|nr:hypothetical protein BV25DRAFT_1819704 [Artomyces pyxidatus]
MALSLVLLRMIWVAASAMFRRTATENLSREGFFFRSQLGQYAGCLLLSNWLSSIGGLIDIDWVNGNGITEGGASCTAQSVLAQMGQFGSSFFIVAMGLHTFNSLVLRNRQPMWVGVTLISVGWIAAIVIGAGPAGVKDQTLGPLYGAVGTNCGITRAYPVSHMLLYFLPLWLSALISSVVYSLIFLVLRGTLTINGGLKFKLNPQQRWRVQSGGFEEYQRFVSSIARSMLWFPAVFIGCVLPSSIVQLLDIAGSPVSPGAMAFSLILVHINGVINVVILVNILRVLGPAIRAPGSSTGGGDVEKSGGLNFSRFHEGTSKPAFAPRTGNVLVREKSSATRPSNRQPRQGPVAWTRTTPFISHGKGPSSTDSTARLLTPIPENGHAHSQSASSITSAASLQRSITPKSRLNEQLLPPPPAALQKIMPVVPQLHLLNPNHSGRRMSEDHLEPAGLTAAPRRTRSPVSREYVDGTASPLQSPPKDSATVPKQKTRPEDTMSSSDEESSPLSSSDSPFNDGGSSLISMYLSRTSVGSEQLPAFPSNAHESVVIGQMLPSSSSSEFAIPLADKPKRSLQSTASVSAVGGLAHRSPIPPPLPTPPVVDSPSYSSPSHYATTDQSDYASDSDIALSPPALPPLLSFPRQPAMAALRPESSDAPRDGDGSEIKVMQPGNLPHKLSAVGFASLIASTAGSSTRPSSFALSVDGSLAGNSTQPLRTSTTSSMRALPVPPSLQPGTPTRRSLDETSRSPAPGLHMRRPSAQAGGSGVVDSRLARVGSMVASDPSASVHQVHAAKPQFERPQLPSQAWTPGHTRANSTTGGSRSYGYL